MDRYRILESVGNAVHAVHSYEDLEIHHPSANRKGLQTGRPADFEQPAKRDHARVDGEFEEIRRERDGRVLVKKDFILARDDGGRIDVPAPVAGFVHYLRDPTSAVRVYDRPHDEPGARLLAQSLHMDPASFRIPEGGRVAYGQPLGRMSDTGTPGSVHAHVEVEANQFRRYIRDIDQGVIAPGRWPGRGHEVAGESPSRPPGAQRGPAERGATDEARTRNRVLERGDSGVDVRALQGALNRLGARDAQGRPLVEDGDFGPATRTAVEAFQRSHGLSVDGRVGKETRESLDERHGQRITDHRHPHYPLFEQVLGRVQAAEAERGVVSGAHSMNIAAALVVEMHRQGIDRADRVELNDSARLVRVVQTSASGLREQELATMPIDTREASRRSIHESSDQLAEAANNRSQTQPQQRAEIRAPAMTL